MNFLKTLLLVFLVICITGCAEQNSSSSSSSNSSSSTTGDNGDTGGDGDTGGGSKDTKAPELSEVSSVKNPTNNTTPSYTFTSNEKGTINYGGGCESDNKTADNSKSALFTAILARSTQAFGLSLPRRRAPRRKND